MKQYIQDARAYIITYKKDLIIGTAIAFAAMALIVVIVLFIYSRTPKIVHQPATACDLFTSVEAKELLGAKVIKSGAQAPIVSDDTATSTCGYTDGNPDMNSAIVAAITVRSGINDKGVQQNKTEFASGKPKNAETVKNVGDSAYFNNEVGQLNVLDGRKWIIVSYGIGATPQANTVEKAVTLAKKVVN